MYHIIFLVAINLHFFLGVFFHFIIGVDSDYIKWQRRIGRDINPSKLTALAIAAGAKRVVLTAPTYTAVAATSVPALQGDAVVNYGGLEDD